MKYRRPGAKLAAAFATALLVAACGGASTSSAPPLPSHPVAPPGAESVAAFSGVAPGRVGVEVDVGGENAIVHAICEGSGTLFVVPETDTDPPIRSVGTAVVDCASPANEGRAELFGLPREEVTFTAYVVEGSGASRPTVFSVSIERATD